MRVPYFPQFIRTARSVAGDAVVDVSRESLVSFVSEALYQRNSVTTFSEISSRDDVRRTEFGTERTVEFTPPVFYDSLPTEIERLLGRHHSPRPYVLEVPDVSVYGPAGHIRTSDGQFLVYNFNRPSGREAAKICSYDLVMDIGHGNVPDLGQPSSHYEHCFSLLSTHASNYTHWTQECLTRLEALDTYVESNGGKPTLLVPADAPSFVYQSLETLGYDDYEWKFVGDEKISVDRLIVPSPRRFSSDNLEDGWIRMPDAFNWIRSRAHDRLSVAETDNPSSRILISREDAGTRRMTNRSAVEDMLSDLGFEMYSPGKMSYEEQVRLFSQAEFIVGTHGAGMVNAIYSSDAPVLELYGSHYLPANYEFAQGQGRRYGCLHCEPVGKDLRVDTDGLRTAIKKLETSN